MALTLAATIQAIINLTETLPGNLATPTNTPVYSVTTTFTNGAGASASNMVYEDERTLANSGTDNLNLTTMLHPFGSACAFLRIKYIYIRNKDTAQTLTVGNGTNPFIFLGAGASTIAVQPGGVFQLLAPTATGIVVTASTGDILKVANGAAGNSAIYDIVLLGAIS